MPLPFINNGDSGLVSRNKINAGLALLPVSGDYYSSEQIQGVYHAENLGIDCTGATDASASLQAVINALPNNAILDFPLAATVKLGTTINITDRVGLQLSSQIRQQNAPGTPQFLWTAVGGTMFFVNHSDHPSFIGLAFRNDGVGGSADYFLNFDGNPGVHIGTLGLVKYCSFNSSGATNANLKCVSISETAVNNHENYIIEECSFFGAGFADFRAANGVTVATTPDVTTPDVRFSNADNGKRVRITYPGRYIDTTIINVVDPQHIVLNVNVPDSKVNVTIHIGQAYGIGVYNGGSQNNIQQQFRTLQFTNLEYGIKIVGGNAEIDHISGSQNDFGIFIGLFAPEQCSINWYESESDARGIEASAPVTAITNSRMSNGSQFGDGFFKFPNPTQVILTGTLQEFACRTGQVVVGSADGTGNSGGLLVSISNRWLNTYSSVGYDRFVPEPVSFNDSFSSFPAAANIIDAFNGNAALAVSINTDHAGGTSLKSNIKNRFSDNTTPLVGISSESNAFFINSFSAFRANGIGGDSRIASKQILFDAEWPNGISGTAAGGSGPGDAFSFYAGAAGAVTGTLPNLYGLYIAKQNGANITAPWGVYQADAGDRNFFAGPVQFGTFTVTTLPTPVTGMTAYITDGDGGLAWGATAINSGAGATKYLVWYNGTNWTVVGK